MRFFLSVLLVTLISALAEYFFPWWSVAVVSFLAALLVGGKPGKAFLMGFFGVGLLWLTDALLHDIANEHILSTRMASLFHLPNYTLFIVVTVLIGGLVGGLSARAGALLKPAPKD